MPAGPPYLKCTKKNSGKIKLKKIPKKFLDTFQVRRACEHSVGNDTMPAGLPKLKCFKKDLRKNKIKLLEIFSSLADPQPSSQFRWLSRGPTKLEMCKKKLI
jgi:hypothetical protein